jgi:hypothetical protein
MSFFNESNVIYEGNGEKLLDNKNISLIPYFVTEQKYVENGLLNGVENVTNTQTGAVNLRINLLLVMVIGKQIQPIPYMI